MVDPSKSEADRKLDAFVATPPDVLRAEIVAQLRAEHPEWGDEDIAREMSFADAIFFT
ncbi:MAG TPA: hypothetical protein VGM06_05535 [Polyangiaceae bacterium]|jgi:hypothetical protein